MKEFDDRCPGCVACRGACPFLAEYGTPDRILREYPERSFSCTACRRCDSVCPRGLSPSAAFLDEKRRLVRQGQVPPPVRKALENARGFAKAGHGFPFSSYTGNETLFWPGCGLAANRPGVVRKLQQLLSRRLQKPVGLALDCCHDPVYGLGDAETASLALQEIGKRLRDCGAGEVITGCLNCHKLLSEHLKGIPFLFILEVLKPEGFKIGSGGPMCLHHPCPSSGWEKIRNRAREWSDRMDPSPEGMAELPAAHCCGAGGGLSAFDPGLADRFLDRITGERKQGTVVTYCTGCQNRLLERGIPTAHLLEWLAGATPRRRVPAPLRQWLARFALAMAARLDPRQRFRRAGRKPEIAGGRRTEPEKAR